jgi:anti-sigma factor (TIGR02949 family)
MAAPGRFSCDETLRRLDDFVDRALRPEELARVEEHLADCVACAEAVHFERALIAGIRARLRRIALPAGLLESIHTRLITETIYGQGGANLPPGGS